ncbi:ribonuclease M5 [Paenibacillus arenosi]|uniref:Ribonuclease M5 n=1 Tax=Paenibacillus arenosi TaxID=2774142 RepID=A0ABR9B2Y3_9BACL|nr:ribonuclease M5 [Paenibacillus arenosi]MBD8500667.1 ribonuclease M5 [Paenibacillus arenosi]
MIRELIVVEGRDDTVAIKRAVKADTIETGGSALNEMTFRKIALAQERRGVIIFTDPDFAGERIRKAIAARVPGCKHAFITKDKATANGDIGVENASPEHIREALSRVKSEMGAFHGTVLSWTDLIEAGLTTHPGSADRRMRLGELLGIGYCNAKQFLKRCTAFQISREEFEDALTHLYREIEQAKHKEEQ